MADQDGSSLHEQEASSDIETIIPAREDVPRVRVDDVDSDAATDLQTEDGGGRALSNRYREILRARHDEGSEISSTDAESVDAPPKRSDSPIESVLSHDQSPSIQGSGISSPGSSVLPSVASRPGPGSPTPSFRPFDRRFSSGLSSPQARSSRPGSPAFLSAHSRHTSLNSVGAMPGFLSAHSRHASLSSNFIFDHTDTEPQTPPWEVVRWTKLSKLNSQAFSESGRRNFGSPTCLVVSASIVLGTSKGIILVFDYGQNLKMIIGPGTRAVESGPVTSVAVSADHTTIAGGHANGDVFTWDTSRASRPFLTIPHLEETQEVDRNADGHVPNVAVIHLGFLGTRHTALVSADDHGMAFSHLATRGTGPLGRTVRTTRILGRYPNAPNPRGKPLKPSTVLAFAPLPYGNVERATDAVGLTAMLTPYLLVIVSTTPVAQTQHKSARPKDVPAHSAMTGCLAWFPAVKLKVPDPVSGSDMSLVKLVYCWSNVLTVLDVEETAAEDKDQPPSFKFLVRSRWTCEEAIVAVQWLSRSVLTVLTISQRLIVLEDKSMRMTEAFDLMGRHIYHGDLFSKRLHRLVEQLDETDVSMHGVVADAFYMSFKAYKGRLFLLGFSEVSIGALSNWADRLIALMEHGKYIAAVQLATSYYTGDADKLTVGLPEDTALRHNMVRDKIMEIMGASLKYALGQKQKNPQASSDTHLRQLAETCFETCRSIDNINYIFDEIYEGYENAEVEGIFLETLEPYILEETITVVPPTVVKSMVSHYASRGWESRLEEIICHMDPTTLDLDEAMLLCKQHGLYDALIYIWNQAMNDYITPMIDLLTLLIPLMANANSATTTIGDDFHSINAVKIFAYLSYILTGRIYPNGEPMDEERASKAKAEIYWFLFSGNTITWPKGSGHGFICWPDRDTQPSFPYLRMILTLDAPSFLSSLNEAFEDSFLNDAPDRQITNGGSPEDLPEEQIFGLTINRQYVLSIMLDVMNPRDFAPEDTIYLDMFVARNLPKFPQYLLFSGSTLTKVLAGLCQYPGEDLAEDAQLSAEYLLSAYQPSDMASMMPLFKKAGFFRILKRTYKTEKQYGRLVETYFEDPEDRESVFDCISDCLRPHSGLKGRQVDEVRRVVEDHTRDLLDLSASSLAVTLASQAKAVHQHVLDSAKDAPELQHEYLKALLEPEEPVSGEREAPDRDLMEQHVRLLCRFDASHVSEYVGSVPSANLRLEKLLPTMEETGTIDAAVVLMAREGQVRDAMDRLVKHLNTLESALHGLIDVMAGDDTSDARFEMEDLLASMQKYVYVGIWLCEGQTKTCKRVTVAQKSSQSAPDKLSPDEALWLNLIDAGVQITRRLAPAIEAVAEKADAAADIDKAKLLGRLRSLVQHTFTSLLASTSSQDGGPRGLAGSGPNLSFLRILRAFLAQAAASSPSLADLRDVLTSIFSAYAYEESILRLSNRLLERSLFLNISQSVERRQRGWRPRRSTCEACSLRVWGPGISGSAVLEAWKEKQVMGESTRTERKRRMAGRARGEGGELDGQDKGKRLDVGASRTVWEPETEEADRETPLGPLVVLACRHIYHQGCLDALQEKQGQAGREHDGEYRCPIDG